MELITYLRWGPMELIIYGWGKGTPSLKMGLRHYRSRSKFGRGSSSKIGRSSGERARGPFAIKAKTRS